MIEIIGKPKFETKQAIRLCAQNCFSRFDIKSNMIVEIIFVGLKKIRRLNAEHRKIDKATDVLSFPQNTIESDKSQLFGSIVICEDMIKNTLDSDTKLIQHGFLHLMGFDHEKNIEAWNQAEKKLVSTTKNEIN